MRIARAARSLRGISAGRAAHPTPASRTFLKPLSHGSVTAAQKIAAFNDFNGNLDILTLRWSVPNAYRSLSGAIGLALFPLPEDLSAKGLNFGIADSVRSFRFPGSRKGCCGSDKPASVFVVPRGRLRSQQLRSAIYSSLIHKHMYPLFALARYGGFLRVMRIDNLEPPLMYLIGHFEARPINVVCGRPHVAEEHPIGRPCRRLRGISLHRTRCCGHCRLHGRRGVMSGLRPNSALRFNR